MTNTRGIAQLDLWGIVGANLQLMRVPKWVPTQLWPRCTFRMPCMTCLLAGPVGIAQVPCYRNVEALLRVLQGSCDVAFLAIRRLFQCGKLPHTSAVEGRSPSG